MTIRHILLICSVKNTKISMRHIRYLHFKNLVSTNLNTCKNYYLFVISNNLLQSTRDVTNS